MAKLMIETEKVKRLIISVWS